MVLHQDIIKNENNWYSLMGVSVPSVSLIRFTASHIFLKFWCIVHTQTVWVPFEPAETHHFGHSENEEIFLWTDYVNFLYHTAPIAFAFFVSHHCVLPWWHLFGIILLFSSFS